MNNTVNFKYGTIDKYRALAVKDNDTIYFADGQIFKGDKVFSQKIEKVGSLPESPSQGIIYILPDFSAKFYNGIEYQDLSVGTIGEISDSVDNDDKVVTQGAIKAYLKKKLENVGASEEIEAKIEQAKTEAIEEATSTASEDATKKINTVKEELQQSIESKIASVFTFKGSKDSLDEIEAIVDSQIGDVWAIVSSGEEYVYTGEKWELLGITVDLSSYVTDEEMTSKVNEKFEELITTLASYYDKNEIDNKINGIQTSIEEAKVEAISIATTNAQEKANQALADAKVYADTLNTAIDSRVSATEEALTWTVID